eukprot:CAMPEP_0114554894 /NCGR_PEP_ID=MMETSP0114-20121206/8453_1 /TAXON_ID=31324 /ORGANISM="Goniomonas sp, Strain m" /LENGTH=330 /DNA_ID=CAMNT_0001739971 /DNA_START=112 /DNA_END=1101 /DNA_ORIENTATION=-
MACSSVPSMMRAVRVHEIGDASTLRFEETVPVPSDLKPNQILVRTEYSGINYIDTYHRSGLYKLPLPFVIGREGAGEVAALGVAVEREKRFSLGDRVAYFAQGSCAEFVAVEADSAYKLPEQVSTEVAAASFLQGLTAHYLASTTYAIRPGDWVLVHAAAGGTGQLLVQIAKLRGATVIATVGSEAKSKIAKDCGADHVVNYGTTDFSTEVLRLTEGKGCAAVYDGVGLATYQGSMKCVKRLGVLVLFGNASGPVPPINPLDLTNAGSIYLVRPSLKDYIATVEELDSRSDELFHWLSTGKLKLNVAQTFSLSQVADAHRALESRALAGK